MRETAARQERERQAKLQQEKQDREDLQWAKDIGRKAVADLNLQIQALTTENEQLKQIIEQEIKSRREQESKAEEEQERARTIQKLVAQNDSLSHEIEQLKKENQELHEKLQESTKLLNDWKLAELNAKREKFLKKSKQDNWDISQASQEDIEYLFEEFGILPLLLKFNQLGYSTLEDFMIVDIQTAADSVEIGLQEACEFVFNIELISKGIFTKEDKEKHLQSCPICRMPVKQGLREYGISGEASEMLSGKLAGLHLGEVMTLSISNFPRFGIDEAPLKLSLGKAIKSMKGNHTCELD